MILPFHQLDDQAHEPLPQAVADMLNGFVRRNASVLLATLPRALCTRDGHKPVARWRGDRLRCWRCQRCGQESQL